MNLHVPDITIDQKPTVVEISTSVNTEPEDAGGPVAAAERTPLDGQGIPELMKEWEAAKAEEKCTEAAYDAINELYQQAMPAPPKTMRINRFDWQATSSFYKFQSIDPETGKEVHYLYSYGWQELYDDYRVIKFQSDGEQVRRQRPEWLAKADVARAWEAECDNLIAEIGLNTASEAEVKAYTRVCKIERAILTKAVTNSADVQAKLSVMQSHMARGNTEWPELIEELSDQLIAVA